MMKPEDSLPRPGSPFMDSALGQKNPVLDHGFVSVVDYMGNDAAVVQAARTSYGRGTKTKNEDRGLIRYLMRHHHTTPFEMCEIKLHVKLPVFVARQWIRHRTANVNEYSARYSILDKEFYIPEADHIARQSQTNKQGRGETLPNDIANAMAQTINWLCDGNYQIYDELRTGWPWLKSDGSRYTDSDFSGEDGGQLDHDPREPHEEEHGMARELARMVLPPNIYTQWYWKVDLHNLLHFLQLRSDPHAQMEIRAYAEVISEIVRHWMPLTWEAFEDYRLGAVTLSRMEAEALYDYFKCWSPDRECDGWPEPKGLSMRERTEFFEKMGLV